MCSLCSQCVPSKDFLKENSETLNIKRGTNCKKTRWETLYPAPSVFLIVPGVLSVFLLWYLLFVVFPVCTLCVFPMFPVRSLKRLLKENSETLNIKWGTNSKGTRWETFYPAPSYVLSVLSLWSTLLVVFPVCNLCVPHISVLFWVCSQVCSRLCPSTSLQPRD